MLKNNILRGFIMFAVWLMVANVSAGKHDFAPDQEQLPSPIQLLVVRQYSEVIRLLNEEQQRQYGMLRQENTRKRQMHHAALRENHRQMDKLAASGAYTEKKAARLAEQQGAIATEMAKLEAAEMAKLYSMLTPEQQQKFSEIKSRTEVWCW